MSKYFAFKVLGWLNEQVVSADDEESARAQAKTMAAGKENVQNFREVEAKEAAIIRGSW